MAHYPLLIDFRGTVFGRGFVAEVSAHGRLLATQEEAGDWWLYGVNPGAIAAHGESLDDAHEEFREAFKAIVVQFASEAGSFDAFREEVERFVYATNGPTESEWDEALERVRRNKEEFDGLPVEFAGKSPVAVKVAPKMPETVTPDNNRVDVKFANAA